MIIVVGGIYMLLVIVNGCVSVFGSFIFVIVNLILVVLGVLLNLLVCVGFLINFFIFVIGVIYFWIGLNGFISIV